jgi:hypothetical protein
VSAQDEAPGAQQGVAWILLCGYLLIAGFARGVYIAHGAEPSARFALLVQGGLWLLMWYWFVQQLAPYKPAFPMDMGVFVVVLWFILVPYYLWHYERWRGIAKVLVLMSVWAFSAVLSSVVAVALG